MEKPQSNRPLIFKDLKDDWHIGLYIEEDKQFFIGFKDEGGFRFEFEIKEWDYIKEFPLSRFTKK